MDYGNYNGGGYRPAGYSAHERWLMGWLEPIELTAATTVSSVPALNDQPQAYLIRNDGYDNEYYIVENRQQQGWDSSLPGSGLVVFHVDFDPDVWTSVLTCPNHPDYRDDDGQIVPAIERYNLFHANNSTSYSKWPYPYNSNDSLTNTSVPAATLNNANTDGSMLMNKSLYDMRVENGLASFRFANGHETAVAAIEAEGTPQILYRLGPIMILRYPNGTIKKVVN